MPTYTATSERELEDLIPLVHDMYFPIDSVVFDRERGVVEIPFSRTGRETDPLTGALPSTVSIGDVIDMHVADTEGVGFYNVNELRYDAKGGVLTVVTGIPLTLRCKVTRCDVRVST